MITIYSAHEPSMVDRIHYLFQREGEVFSHWLDKHLREPDHYVFKGRGYFLMGWHACADESVERECWVVYFAYLEPGIPLPVLLDLMPYPLDYVAFVRGLRGKKDLKYYRTDRLRKLCDTLA